MEWLWLRAQTTCRKQTEFSQGQQNSTNYVQKTGAQCWTTSRLRSHLPTSCFESFRFTHPTIRKKKEEPKVIPPVTVISQTRVPPLIAEACCFDVSKYFALGHQKFSSLGDCCLTSLSTPKNTDRILTTRKASNVTLGSLCR